MLNTPKKQYEPVTSGRLYEQIVEQIEGAVVAGELKAGDRLPSERELGEQFGVSRTAIREAVNALTQKGLVEVFPGRGTFITDGTTKAVRHSLGMMMQFGHDEDARNLVEIREILEPEIAALAAARAKEEHIALMQNAVDEMDKELNNSKRFVEADLEFHLALAEAAQNVLITTLLTPIIDILREQRERISLVDGGLKRGQYHHKRILKAVMKNDSEAASKAMRAHLKQVRKDSEASLK